MVVIKMNKNNGQIYKQEKWILKKILTLNLHLPIVKIGGKNCE